MFEADGPCPGLYSMTELGMVVIREDLEVKDMPFFYGQFAPLPGAKWMQEALDVCNRTRLEVENFPSPADITEEMYCWLKENGGNRCMFISDNNGFDFQFVNYYLWKFIGENPFGHSSMNLGSLFKGLNRNTFESFKHLRKGIPHDHNPVHDAQGNVLALLRMKEKFDLKIKLK
jgi:hypothetical protein